MAITVTLTEDQYHLLSQALGAREQHLERIASSHPHMAAALPEVREIHQLFGQAYTAFCTNRRNGPMWPGKIG